MWRGNPGRVAAALYLLTGLPAAFAYMYVTRRLVIPADASATAANILASEGLFRLGMVSELISSSAFVFLLLALHRLLGGIDPRRAAAMVVLALVGIAIATADVINELAALILLRGPELLTGFDRPQIEALALFFLRLHGRGLLVAQVFWGLWLVPLGVLVIRSGSIPRWLGVLLVVNGIAYPLVSLTWFLAPAYGNLAARIALVPELGELWFVLWLLIRGADVQQTRSLSAVPATT